MEDKSQHAGTQNNVRGSAVALDRLWAFGGGNPFGPTYQDLTKDTSARPLDQTAIKDNPLVPLATNDTVVYDPMADSWSSAAPMNMQSPFTSGTAIGAKLIAAGSGSPFVPASASVEVLDACIPAPTPTPCPGDHYTIAAGTDMLVPGDTDVGSHCDECDTIVTLPFPFQLYNGTFNSVSVSSNGRLDFVVPNESGGYATSCLPASQGSNGPYDFTIFALWHDLTTETGLSGCSNFASGCGIFTSVSGNAPNRIFNIEFRTVRFDDNTQTQQFEVRLYENRQTGSLM